MTQFHPAIHMPLSGRCGLAATPGTFLRKNFRARGANLEAKRFASRRRRDPVAADIDLQLVCRRKISQTQLSRRHSGPSLAGMGERAYFPIAEEPRYLGNRQFPFPQIAFGKNFPQLLQHLRE
jgi:hypothetical protein